MITRTTELENSEYSKSIIRAAFEKYKEATFDKDGDSNLCGIHEIFRNEKGQNSHSCIACNLAEISEYILKSLNNLNAINNQLDAFISFCLPAYLAVERFEEVFRIIKLPDYYGDRHFKVFKLIRRWANFFKHPKAFLFVHHPEYYFSDELSVDKNKEEHTYIIIDSDFVQKHYTGDSNNTKLYKALTNKDRVVVIFPSLYELVDDLIIAQNHFIDIISNNKVFREVLTDKSVLENYFEQLDEEEIQNN